MCVATIRVATPITTMNEDNWYSSNDPNNMAQRSMRVLRILLDHQECTCLKCHVEVCGHAVVFSIVAGHEKAPMCLSCIAQENGRDVKIARDEMVMFVHSKPCLTQGWRLANLNEGFLVESLPDCHWQKGEDLQPQETKADEDSVQTNSSCDQRHDNRWDAGDLGCGELVLKLRIRMQKMDPGERLFLTATDPGAPSDIPAWCRLTGHRLVSSDHPNYFIERKSES